MKVPYYRDAAWTMKGASWLSDAEAGGRPYERWQSGRVVVNSESSRATTTWRQQGLLCTYVNTG